MDDDNISVYELGIIKNALRGRVVDARQGCHMPRLQEQRHSPHPLTVVQNRARIKKHNNEK